MDEQVNPLERDHSLSVVLPGGLEKNATVHGSKPVMDLLVTLCASYHLNPSDYTVEVLSPNKNNISFKPNSPIGSLEAEKIVLKPRGAEEKIRRPYMPEASVRLLINYNKSHKAVVRVSPRVPLETLLPVVCDKCEFKVETTVLLRDSQSTEPLDTSKTLNEHGLREVFAKDAAAAAQETDEQPPKTPEAAATPPEAVSPPPLQDLPKREKKPKRSTGFLSLFRRGKKKTEMEWAASAPPSPGLNKQAGVDPPSSNAASADTPKKRRAPQPPMGASQSVPSSLSTCHLGGAQMSAESTLRRTKRRAPPPPCANAHHELQADAEVKGTLNTLELRESDESDSIYSRSSSSSPRPSHAWSSPSRRSFAQLHELADPYLPSFRGKDLSKDFSDARSALAKVLTSSVSKTTLVKRLKNSATFPKLYNASSFTSTTPRSSDDGRFCAELEPISTSGLPTEPEWEDPAQRKGMTTFKVVPAKKLCDPQLAAGDPDQTIVGDTAEGRGSPEQVKSQTEEEEEEEEEPASPGGSESGRSLPSPAPSPPVPPDSDQQGGPGSPLAQAGDPKQEAEGEPEAPSPPPAPSPAMVDGADECPGGAQISADDANELLQSPSRRSVSTDTDRRVSDSDERGVDEEVGEEEEEVEGEEVKEVEEEEVKEVEQEEVKEVEQEEGEEEEVKLMEQEEVEEEEEEEVKEEEEEVEEEDFPPPPPPVFFNEEVEVVDEGREDAAAAPSSSSHPPMGASSEDPQSHLTPAPPVPSAAAPKPVEKTSSAPSRFAQAVALAVQKARLHSREKGLGPQAPSSPRGALASPPRTIYQFGA